MSHSAFHDPRFLPPTIFWFTSASFRIIETLDDL